MRLLLDTHIWLWLNLEPARLPARFAEAMADPDNDLVVSIATVWELSIKHGLGKISVGGPFLPFVESALEGTELLGVHLHHVARGHGLPSIHRDPFDRMLVAQALADGLTFVTVDPLIPPYGVSLLPS